MSVVDCCGGFIAPLVYGRKVPTWRGRGCAVDPADYIPTNMFRADSASNLFEVYPPVPECADVWVEVRCVESPPALTDADLDSPLPDCKYKAALTQWALYRALSGDSDTTLMQASAVHYRAFFDLLGLQMKADAMFMERPTK